MKRSQYFRGPNAMTNKRLKPIESKNVSKKLREKVWEMYAGPNKKEMKCFLCNHTILKRYETAGWQGCHVVAQLYHSRKPTKFDLVPGCAACNRENSDICLLDFLWCKDRLRQLEKIIRIIYQAWSEAYPVEFQDRCDGLACNLLRHLFADEFKMGGGIKNRQIYDIANNVQRKVELEKIVKYLQKINRANMIVEKCSKPIK